VCGRQHRHVSAMSCVLFSLIESLPVFVPPGRSSSLRQSALERR